MYVYNSSNCLLFEVGNKTSWLFSSKITTKKITRIDTDKSSFDQVIADISFLSFKLISKGQNGDGLTVSWWSVVPYSNPLGSVQP